MRRLTILLSVVGAFLLVPAAQAFANGTLTVNIEGSGSGEVSSVGGFGGPYEGSPPIECSYASPGPTTGVCEDEMSDEGEGVEAAALHYSVAPGSKFAGWIVEEGSDFGNFCANGKEHCFAYVFQGGGNTKVTAIFEEEAPSGPTNLRTLTITKSPSSSTGGGVGSVSSKPKGIKCGTACDEAVAAMYESTPVELTAKPSTGSTFVEWTGACSGASPTCTLPMSNNESVGAVFGGVSKAFSPAEPLTLTKGESSGKGTVKAAGLGCEAECTSTTVLYQGPITEPKVKAGKVVILKQAPAFGSKFTGWTGCTEISPTECEVKMEEAKEVTAEYEALPNKTLTINKAYAKGNGSVSSKPKGIKCGTTCTSQSASMPEGASVELTAKPTTGTFVKWVGGDCNESTSTICVAVMNTDETIEAVFSEPGKAIAEAKTLTLTKAGSGFGTVKASGLTCEVLCTSAASLYQGPITGEKPKPGKVVILKATSAPGSKAVEWTGCTVLSPSECEVKMEADEAVTATFDELE